MKFESLIIALISITICINCTSQKYIELPLSHLNGYGNFNSQVIAMSTYSENKDNPWKKTNLSVTGAPENWTEVKYGDIETNIYQSIYQNYIIGNISKEMYKNLQKSWNWKPDTLKLSREPIKTKIAFATGKDTLGNMKMILDTNNNRDFSDDKSFIPINYSSIEKTSKDSIALKNSINISFERLINNKKESFTAPVFITYMNQIKRFMYNFPQYSVANFNDDKIAIISDDFTNLSYEKPDIVLINDSLNKKDKISHEKLIAKNEFLEIKGKIYKNIGVNINNNSLELERIDISKDKLNSTQIGYKSFPFKGKDFITNSQITSEQLKGKYVLLDFWAVWCGPCIKEISNLKNLYEKTDREKFEIIGIVGDSPKKTLRKIIQKDSITWSQIFSNDSNKIKETYKIKGYPTTFLINPEGVIIAKNLRGKELDKKVLSLINQ